MTTSQLILVVIGAGTISNWICKLLFSLDR